LRESGKGLNGEWVSIIQHPKGEVKQIVLRENRIVLLPEEQRVGAAFLHYTSDTERGSSGSPVFNDQFDVLALHHKSVPRYDRHGNLLTRTGKRWTIDMGDDEIHWIANEGIRISSLFDKLDRLALSSPHAASLLALLSGGEPRGPFVATSARGAPLDQDVGEGEPLEATSLAKRKGYAPNFLGFPVPLPKLTAASLKKKVAKLLDGSGVELRYTHFSVVVNGDRRLAFFAAVNIDGSKERKPTVKPAWRLDPRIAKAAIADNELYRGDTNPLDRGHLVRRLDPVWGTQDEANEAVKDTYHYTNAAPQEHRFNDGLWGDLEDYILQLAQLRNHKMTVFTGPVFAADDGVFGESRPGGPWQIPARFWKVIVYVKADGTKSATGFVLDQSDEIANLLEGFTPLPQAREVARVHQRTVKHIEGLTALDFAQLKTFDPLDQLEATKQVRRIRLPEQIVM
jgi:endonuclease G